MSFGMTGEQFDLLKRLVIEPLKTKHCQVFIFGSRASGKCHPYSDVDVLYRPGADTELEPGFISNLLEAAEESRLPFKVDLVLEKDLAASYRDRVFAEMIEV